MSGGVIKHQDVIIAYVRDHPGQTTRMIASAIGLQYDSAYGALGGLYAARRIHRYLPASRIATWFPGVDQRASI